MDFDVLTGEPMREEFNNSLPILDRLDGLDAVWARVFDIFCCNRTFTIDFRLFVDDREGVIAVLEVRVPCLAVDIRLEMTLTLSDRKRDLFACLLFGTEVDLLGVL